MKPKSNPSLVVTEIGEELLVFNPIDHQAHNLNAAAATVFRACNGETPLEELKSSPQGPYALHLLAEKGLLESPLPPLETVSRRELLSRLGQVALLPALLTVGVPSPSAALSGVTQAECLAGAPGVCGQPCIDDPLPNRVCAAVAGDPDTRCACIAVGSAEDCQITLCTPA